MQSFTPEVYGKYFLIDKIAVGGMAEIFKAKSYGHGGFEKLLVIKRILSHLSENEDFVSMFVDEANVSVALQHANIVQTYDFGKIQQNYFIAMEYVEGKDIKAVLRLLSGRRKILPIEFSVYVAHEICKGLDYAHRRTDLRGEGLGIVHRDMSPSNVIISYEGEVKIADFGIAKAEKKTYTTKDGVLKGKFEYMSPEQASGESTDRRSDIFSSGIILYECLTGRRLFKTDSEIKTLERIRACEVDPPSILNPAIPARLDQIVLKALARRPGERYQEAREFQNELLEFLYPATPDLTRQSFAHFLRELFAEDIREERQRLEEGSRVALEMRARMPEEGFEGTGPTTNTVVVASSRLPLFLGLVGVILLVGLVLFIAFKPDAPPVVVEPPPSPTTGTLELRVQVPARVWLDGVLVGEGALVQLRDIPPGPEHLVRISAEGYQDFEEKVAIEAGDQLRMPVRLTELGKEPPPEPPQIEKTPPQGSNTSPQTSESPALPRILFKSNPPGAEVLVGGRSIGRTNLSWTEGQPGARIQVEYRKEGFNPVSFSEEVPAAGQSASFAQSLAPVANDPGRISVNVSKGWANVFIDGRKIPETTPLANYNLPAGEHTIRVSNPELGIEQSRKVTVRSGASERVSFSVE